MSEYLHVEEPFLDQLGALGWTVVDQGYGIIPSAPAASLRVSFREWLLPDVFRNAVRGINRTAVGQEWLTERQLEDLRDQLIRHPSRTLLEANEAVQKLLFKAQVDVNETTGEPDPVVQLIDFAHPERNGFHAINQFRIDTPGCVKSCIIPDIVLFVNGIPLVVVVAKIGDPNTANPIYEAFVQLLRYRNARLDCVRASRACSIPTCCWFEPAARRPNSAQSLRGTNTSTPGKISGQRAAENIRPRSAPSANRSG